MKKQPVLERHVISPVLDLLRYHHWRIIRCEYRPGSPMQAPVGEAGMPDYLALHYLRGDGVVAAMWLEFKSPSDRRECRCAGKNAGKKRVPPCTVCAQKRWADEEEQLGAVVLRRVDNFEAFREWYMQKYSWITDLAKGQMSLIG